MCIPEKAAIWGGIRMWLGQGPTPAPSHTLSASRWDLDAAGPGSDASLELHTVRFSSGADNTAAVHTQHVGFNRQEQDVFLLPILVVDSGPPTLSSTGTLTIRICGCDSSGTIQSCNTTAFVMAASLSPGALIALLVCVLILVGKFKNPAPHDLVFCLDRPHPGRGAPVPPTYG